MASFLLVLQLLLLWLWLLVLLLGRLLAFVVELLWLRTERLRWRGEVLGDVAVLEGLPLPLPLLLLSLDVIVVVVVVVSLFV